LAVLLSLGGGGAIVLGMSSWLGKLWATRMLEKEKAKYATELEVTRNEYRREMEQLTAQLQLHAFEHQTRFSYYHEKKCEVIAELYRLLDEVTKRLAVVMSPSQTPAQRETSGKEIVEPYNHLVSHFYGRKIFLDRDVCDQVEAIMTTMRSAITNWGISQMPGWPAKDGTLLWAEASKAMERSVPPLLAVLEERFRAILSGVEPAGGPITS